MSLKTFLVSVEDAAIGELKKIGSVVENFVLSEYQKLAAAVNATSLGTTVMNVIALLDSHAIPGAQKMEQLVQLALPAAEKLAARGGLPGLTTSVETFLRRYAQDAVDDFKAATAPLVLRVSNVLQPAPGT